MTEKAIISARGPILAGVSGIAATAVDLIALTVLVEVSACPVGAAAFFGAISGAGLNFVMNKWLAFKDGSAFSAHQLGRYLFVALVNALLMAVGVSLLSSVMPYLAAKALWAAVIFLTWTFPAQSVFVFPRQTLRRADRYLTKRGKWAMATGLMGVIALAFSVTALLAVSAFLGAAWAIATLVTQTSESRANHVAHMLAGTVATIIFMHIASRASQIAVFQPFVVVFSLTTGLVLLMTLRSLWGFSFAPSHLHHQENRLGCGAESQSPQLERTIHYEQA